MTGGDALSELAHRRSSEAPLAGRGGAPPALTVPASARLASIVASYAGRSAAQMQVRDAMSTVVLTVGPGHTLRQAAKQMAERKVGAAVVVDPEEPAPGIITERDVLQSIGSGQDPDTEQV